jgi:hypothetical protein
MDLELEREPAKDREWDQSWLGSESGEESVETLERDALKNLCGELMEEVFDESSFPLKK